MFGERFNGSIDIRFGIVSEETLRQIDNFNQEFEEHCTK